VIGTGETVRKVGRFRSSSESKRNVRARNTGADIYSEEKDKRKKMPVDTKNITPRNRTRCM